MPRSSLFAAAIFGGALLALVENAWPQSSTPPVVDVRTSDLTVTVTADATPVKGTKVTFDLRPVGVTDASGAVTVPPSLLSAFRLKGSKAMVVVNRCENQPEITIAAVADGAQDRERSCRETQDCRCLAGIIDAETISAIKVQMSNPVQIEVQRARDSQRVAKWNGKRWVVAGGTALLGVGAALAFSGHNSGAPTPPAPSTPPLTPGPTPSTTTPPSQTPNPTSFNKTYTGTIMVSNNNTCNFNTNAQVTGILSVDAQGNGAWRKTHVNVGVTFTFNIHLNVTGPTTATFDATTTQNVQGTPFSVHDVGMISGNTLNVTQTFTPIPQTCLTQYFGSLSGQP